MSKKMNDFLPKAAPDKVRVQAMIPADLHEAVRHQMDIDTKNGVPIDWTVLFTAACRIYLSERGAKDVS